MRHRRGKILPTGKEWGHIITIIILIFLMVFMVYVQELWTINQSILGGIFIGFIIYLSTFSMVINEYRESKERHKKRAFLLSFFAALIGTIGLGFLIPMINLISCYVAYLVIEKYSRKIGVPILVGTVLGYFLCMILSIVFWAFDILNFLMRPEISLSFILILIPLILELIRRSHKKRLKKEKN